MQKLKNKIIKALGGHTSQEVRETINDWADDVNMLVAEIEDTTHLLDEGKLLKLWWYI